MPQSALISVDTLTEYRKKEEEWFTCQDCKKEFRPGNCWFNGEHMCPACEDARGNW